MSPTRTLPSIRISALGYAQSWQVSVQRDLPASLQMVVTYNGIKGTRGLQAFYPNTYAPGGVDPFCPTCIAGYKYLASNANSTREAGILQLRRRLHNGFTATVVYTYSKSIDDSAGLGGAGGALYAQNWLDLSAERGLSTFDQRHLVNLTGQYTTGQGIGGGTLLSGWRGQAIKEWTFTSQINAGTGLPLTPVDSDILGGTGVGGSLRPDYTGAPLYAAAQGNNLNKQAYVLPPAGQFGNAGRDTITGPSMFTFNATMARTFRVNDRINLTLTVSSTNPINHVTYANWITNISICAVRTARSEFRQSNAKLRHGSEDGVLIMRQTIAVFLSWTLIASAQQVGQNSTNAGPAATFQATTQLVVETVAIKDKSGKPVTGLTKENFTVTEDGMPRPSASLNTSNWINARRARGADGPRSQCGRRRRRASREAQSGTAHGQSNCG